MSLRYALLGAHVTFSTCHLPHAWKLIFKSKAKELQSGSGGVSLQSCAVYERAGEGLGRSSLPFLLGADFVVFAYFVLFSKQVLLSKPRLTLNPSLSLLSRSSEC